MKLVLAYAAIYAWWVAVLLWWGFRVRRFLAATPSIADEQSLDRFKSVARLSMYLALVGMPVFAVGLIVGIVLILRHGLLGLAGVLLANAVVIALALCLAKFEKLARALPASSEHLADRHRRISETWGKKAFPDF